MKINSLIVTLGILLSGSAAMAQESDTIRSGVQNQNAEQRDNQHLEGQNTDRYKLNDQPQQRRGMDDGEPTGVTRPTRIQREDSGYSADTTESSTGAQYQDAPQSSGYGSGLDGAAAGTSEAGTIKQSNSKRESPEKKDPDQ